MKLKELYEAKERSVLTVMGQQAEKVSGDFNCTYNQLTSLEGCPKEVDGNFACYDNQLTSLKGGPKEVDGNFSCFNNKLTSLIGSLQKVGADFICSNNQLTSLEGGPKEVGGNFSCSYNKLTCLVGGPQKVGDYFYCSENELTNLKDIHKQIKFIGGQASFLGNPIKSHVVGLLLIEGLVYVNLDNKKVRDIINKHLNVGRDVFECIDELLEAGFPEFAKI